MLRREDGQTMTEYSVVLAMIAIVTLVAYMALGDAAGDLVLRVRDVVTSG